MNGSRPSLKRTLRLLTIKWAVTGLALSLVAGSACLLYSSKISSESQVRLLAQSVGRAFRPQILRGDVRDAQFQMEFVLSDVSGSRARVLGPDFSEVYPIPGDSKVSCTRVSQFCWNGVRSVTYLHPIYFDDDQKDGVYGYLALTAPTEFNLPLLFSFAALILLLFVIQAFGLVSALGQISKSILGVLSSWSKHLATNPKNKASPTTDIRFSEFEPMVVALDELHLTIAKLEDEAAKQAKEKAQVSVIREIGHDLKTPLSQVAKHFYLLSKEAGDSPDFNKSRAKEIEQIFKRMGDLVRQIREYHVTKSNNTDLIDIEDEVKAFVESTNAVSDGEQIRFVNALIGSSTANIQKTRLYQLLDNLVRNARDATNDKGDIVISLADTDGDVTLTVQDTGSGIDPKIRDKIFDIDFTTKTGKGTGLGLGIVKRICSENGASISVASEMGVGTTFTIQFQKALAKDKFFNHGQGEITI